MALKINRNLANRLKQKVKKFQGDIATFRQITRKNLERGLFTLLIVNWVEGIPCHYHFFYCCFHILKKHLQQLAIFYK